LNCIDDDERSLRHCISIICITLRQSGLGPKGGENDHDVIIPVELKTGKASLQISHRAQVMLYVLMLVVREHSSRSVDAINDMSRGRKVEKEGEGQVSSSQDRTSHPVNYTVLQTPTHGVLLYLNSESTKCETISPKWAEICALIISRNDYAGHIKHSNSLVRTNIHWYIFIWHI
jgi:hypothetical protein